MSMQDPIADMLTRIRNAQTSNKPSVSMPSSKIKEAIANVLKEEGYVQDYISSKEGVKTELKIELKYYLEKPVIALAKRISKPSRRVYSSATPQSVKNGLGIAILSTPKGVMTDRNAQKLNIGGELLCEIA